MSVNCRKACRQCGKGAIFVTLFPARAVRWRLWWGYLFLFYGSCFSFLLVMFIFLFSFPLRCISFSVSQVLFHIFYFLFLALCLYHFPFFLSYYLFLSLSSLFKLYGINISICLSIYRYVWVCTYHFLSHINASILRKYNMKKIIIQNSQCLVIENGSIFPFPLHRKRN